MVSLYWSLLDDVIKLIKALQLVIFWFHRGVSSSFLLTDDVICGIGKKKNKKKSMLTSFQWRPAASKSDVAMWDVPMPSNYNVFIP